MDAAAGACSAWQAASECWPVRSCCMPTANPFAPKPTHFPAKAKRIIYLVMNGGMSHVDTLRPQADAVEVQRTADAGRRSRKRSARQAICSRRRLRSANAVRAAWKCRRFFPRVGGLIDEFCVIRSMWTEVPNHEPSLFMFNTGAIQPGRPSLGSWLMYGLGSESRNLPGFVVLCPGNAGSGLAAVVLCVSARGFSGHVPEEHRNRSVQVDPEHQAARPRRNRSAASGSAGGAQSRASCGPLRRQPTGSFD